MRVVSPAATKRGTCLLEMSVAFICPEVLQQSDREYPLSCWVFRTELPVRVQVFSAKRKVGICGENEDQEVVCWVGHAMGPSPELRDRQGSCVGEMR